MHDSMLGRTIHAFCWISNVFIRVAKPKRMFREVDFDKELKKGYRSYNTKVGEWWLQRANDRAHKISYKKIAQDIRDYFEKDPKSILDYACGSGSLLKELARLFPKTKLIGVDGSTKMLEHARKTTLAEFHQSYLPNFELNLKADVVIFCLPNIAADNDDVYETFGYQERDKVVAKLLANPAEPDEDDENPEEIYDDLLTERVISRNLRQLCTNTCVRITYSDSPRELLSELGQQRTDFEEGCLSGVQGKPCTQLFTLEKSVFHKSKIIEDVYHQTKDEDDKKGGFFVSFLKVA